MKDLIKFGFVLTVGTLKNSTFSFGFSHLKSLSDNLRLYFKQNDFTEEEVNVLYNNSIKLARRLIAGYKAFPRYYISCKLSIGSYDYHISCMSYD